MSTKFSLTPQDEGFIMLCSHLGDPKRPVLTPNMMGTLQKLVSQARIEDPDAVLTVRSLEQMGVKPDLAQRVAYLMSGREQMQRYVEAGLEDYVYPITIASPFYPKVLRQKLGFEGPCCLWARGPADFLNGLCRSISVVGSRDADLNQLAFAFKAGSRAGQAGYVVISGNAKGVDREAQIGAACEYGDHGRVISVIADSLHFARKPYTLYLSENDYDARFSAARALSRNRVIHALSTATLVAASTEGKGGTWSGSTLNLKNRWSPLGCNEYGGAGNDALIRMGAMRVTDDDLEDMAHLVQRLQGHWLQQEDCSL